MVAELPSRRDRALLAAAGASAMCTQIVAVREVGSTVFSTELVILAALVVALIGPSAGYAVGHRVGERTFSAWGAASALSVFALPTGVRAAVAVSPALGAALAGAAVLAVTAFFAAFLARRARPATLPALYAAELAGAALALAWIALAASWRATLALHALAAVLVVHLGVARRALTLAAVAAAALALALYAPLDRAAAEAYYRARHHHARPRLVASAYSPYQRVDVVDDGPSRALYLDGVPFYREGPLDAFNALLAAVPGALRPGLGRALVVGSGSFGVAGRLHRLGYDVTVVELDATVAELGFAHFARVHRLRRGDVRVVVDDGRRFLARDDAGRYDLVALDVPAPYHVRTALLHTVGFYRLVASRLRPGGVVASSLCDRVDGPVGAPIAAALLAAFPDVQVVESEAAGIALAYAGGPVPFAPDAARAEAMRVVPGEVLVHPSASVRARLAGTRPLTERDLAAVLALARAPLEGALRGRE